MRTTIDLPKPLFRDLKASAARSGLSMKEIVTNAIERELERLRSGKSERFEVEAPLIRSKNPGSLKSMTNAEIDEILDGY